MAVHERTLDHFGAELAGHLEPGWARPDSIDVVVVEFDGVTSGPPGGVGESFGFDAGATGMPVLGADVAAVVVGVSGSGSESAGRLDDALPCDVVVGVDRDGLEEIVDQVHTTPIAATVLAQLLRGAERRGFEDAIMLESALYSVLQSGPEFAAWRERRSRRARPTEADLPVKVHREDDVLRIVLDRPHLHNALDRFMRDSLVEALEIALFDPSIERVELSGAGPSFCSGGDLEEFGSFPDPASAHVIRMSTSPARLLHELADRVSVELHGACIGSGIELPAFARHVRARDVSIALPELRFGLIPGAGGTWSLPQRIGRHRTAWLALSGRAVDRSTAVSWGLVTADDGSSGVPDLH